MTAADGTALISLDFIKKLASRANNCGNKTLFYPIYSMCENVELLKYN